MNPPNPPNQTKFNLLRLGKAYGNEYNIWCNVNSTLLISCSYQQIRYLLFILSNYEIFWSFLSYSTCSVYILKIKIKRANQLLKSAYNDDDTWHVRSCMMLIHVLHVCNFSKFSLRVLTIWIQIAFDSLFSNAHNRAQHSYAYGTMRLSFL